MCIAWYQSTTQTIKENPLMTNCFDYKNSKQKDGVVIVSWIEKRPKENINRIATSTQEVHYKTVFRKSL